MDKNKELEYIHPKQGKAYSTANEIAYERIMKTLPNFIAEKYTITYNENTDEIVVGRKDNKNDKIDEKNKLKAD